MLPERLYEQGIHRHPGPGPIPSCKLRFTNITSLNSNFNTVMEAEANLHFINEHGVSLELRAEMETRASEAFNKIINIGPADSHMLKAGGGVGVVHDEAYQVIQLEPITKEFKQAQDSGRALLFCLDFGDGYAVHAYCFYGISGSHECKQKTSCTNCILTAIRKEQRAQPPVPTCTMGDANADACDLPGLQKLLDNHTWFDVGANASWLCGINSEHTCQTATADDASRRDYFFCDSAFFPYISNFKIEHHNGLPTHASLLLEITLPPRSC